MLEQNLSDLANVDAELNVLGEICFKPSCLAEVSEVITAKDFYREQHRILFRAMQELQQENKTIDVVTLNDYLTRQNELEKVGGIPFLTQVANRMPTAAGVRQHAEIIKDYSMRRFMYNKCREIASKAFDASIPIEESISTMQEELADTVASNEQSQLPSMNEALMSYEKILNDRKAGKRKGISTGFKALDDKISCLQPKTLTTIAGDTGMGKSALALNITANICKQGYHVLYFSLEMPREQLIDRLISSLSKKVSVRTLMNLDKHDSELVHRLIAKAMSELKTYHLRIDDRGALTYAQVASRAIAMKSLEGLDVIVIDHIQIMDASNGKSYSNRAQELDVVTKKLHDLAKRLNVSIIILSQVNRDTTKKENKDKRPTLASIRESAGITQNSDNVMAIYRDGYYHQDNQKENAELIVMKVRQGNLGTVYLKWTGDCVLFEPNKPPETMTLSRSEEKAVNDITQLNLGEMEYL